MLRVTNITVAVWQVWCPMTREFMAEYLKCDSASRKQLLYVMNPNKFQACQFLVQYHEEVSSAANFAPWHSRKAVRRVRVCSVTQELHHYTEPLSLPPVFSFPVPPAHVTSS